MNEMTTIAQQNSLAFSLPAESEFRQIKEIASMYFKSGLCPSGVKNPEAATIIALKGRELGMPLMVALSEISVINGKATISGQAMLAFIRKDFPKAIINFKTCTNEECVIEAQRSPEDKITEIMWDMEKAHKMGLDRKDNWLKQPATMLKWRAVSEMKRFVFPEVLMGFYTPEEMTDIPVERDATPISDPAPKPEAPAQAPAQEPVKNHAPQTMAEADDLQKKMQQQKMQRAILAKAIVEAQQKAGLKDLGLFVSQLFDGKNMKALTYEEMQLLKLKLEEAAEVEAEIA